MVNRDLTKTNVRGKTPKRFKKFKKPLKKKKVNRLKD